MNFIVDNVCRLDFASDGKNEAENAQENFYKINFDENVKNFSLFLFLSWSEAVGMQFLHRYSA